MTNVEKRSQGGAQSVRRALAILRSVARCNEQGGRLSVVAKEVALPPPTVHRILSVLHEEGFLSFDPESKQYHLGAELYALGASTRQFSLRDRFHTTLKRISEATDDATYLIMRSGYDVVCIDQVPGRSRIQVLGFDVGERRPLGIGAAGQCLLAFLPEAQQKDVLQANAPRYLKYYGIRKEQVRAWIRQTLADGFATSVRIVSQDSIGVGLPVFNQKGQVVAAISMAGIQNRMTQERCRKIAAIIQSEIEAVAPPSR
jgi:DNA-binding IclR family transcriptional regulator